MNNRRFLPQIKGSDTRALTTNQKKQVRDMIKSSVDQDVEDKIYDNSLSVAVSYSSLFCLTTIPQGIANSQRVGLEVRPKELWINYSFQAADVVNNVRLLVIQYFPVVDNAIVTPSTFWTNPNGAAAPLGFINWTGRDDFKVLYDSRMEGVGTSGNGIYVFQKKITKMRKLLFTNNLQAIASGHIFVLLLSDSGVTPHPNVSYLTRLIYEDA